VLIAKIAKIANIQKRPGNLDRPIAAKSARLSMLAMLAMLAILAMPGIHP
jgi:hypothetical protein